MDRNQPTIVQALRKAGASVQPLHTVGRGCPDILVGFRGINYLFEIKDPLQPPSARVLTKAEADWHAEWRGMVRVVETAEDAFRALGICLSVE